MNKLEQLKNYSTIVADSGDIDSISKNVPTDATTNPSLIFKAVQSGKYNQLVQNAVEYAIVQNHNDNPNDLNQLILDKLSVNFGLKILELIPGRISTEVDSRLSFDSAATINKARYLIDLYQQVGIDKERILIKIAATWEGIKAATQLEKEGIHCNMTLIFSFAQAVVCGDAGVTLISPFVGRILDWHIKNIGIKQYSPADDPGVKSVTQIYNYYKKNSYNTMVMGASFRNVDQILELTGCDLLTIAPDLLEELANSTGEVHHKLNQLSAQKSEIKKVSIDEKNFRWMLNEDAMATEKLAEGIRNFTKDTLKLLELVDKIKNNN